MKSLQILIAFAAILLTACLGTRDVNYNRGVTQREVITEPTQEWWDAVVGLKTDLGPNLFCSGVAIGFSKDKNESYIVSAKHCTTSWTNKVTKIVGRYIGTNGEFYIETFKIKNIYNHPQKDIAFIVIDGEIKHRTTVYKGFVNSPSYVIIGYPGGILTNKVAQRNWADHGQSGGGVFTDGYGLHTIVSTHISGVNVWEALNDLKLTWMVQ